MTLQADKLAKYRSRALGLAVACILSGSAAALSLILAVPPVAQVGIALAGIVLSIAAVRFGFGTTAIVVAILALPPSIIGENFAIVGLSSAVVLIVGSAVSSRGSGGVRGNLLGALALALMGIIFMISALSASGSPNALTFSVIYFSSAVSLLLLRNRRVLSFVFEIIVEVAAIAVLSYLITAAFSAFSSGSLQLGSRTVSVSLPLTLTGGRGGFLDPAPRFLFFAGEGGINIEFLLPLLVFAFWRWAGWRRVLVVLLLLIGLFVGQASTSIVAIGASATFAVAVVMLRRGRVLTSALTVVIVVAVGYWVVSYLLDAKTQSNRGSLLDRGLSATDGSNASLDSTLGNINLLVTLQKNPLIAAGVVVLLFAAFVVARRSVIAFSAAIAILITSLVGQPMQWHAGAWVLFFAVVSLTSPPQVESNSDDAEGIGHPALRLGDE